jgi:hypothetical protein
MISEVNAWVALGFLQLRFCRYGEALAAAASWRANDGDDDDDPFIVLTETKFSIRYIPVWAWYSPLRTRVEAHAITTLLVHW